jgi:hypothetical protein
MSIRAQEIRRWLERKFKDFSVSDHLVGTYGLVWFLTHKSIPETEFAVKTVNPEKEPKRGQDAIAEAPHEPTNYYFQAFWTYASLITELSRPSLDTVEEILKNLDMAIKLAPDWKEPQRLKRELVADCALIGRA